MATYSEILQPPSSPAPRLSGPAFGDGWGWSRVECQGLGVGFAASEGAQPGEEAWPAWEAAKLMKDVANSCFSCSLS